MNDKPFANRVTITTRLVAPNLIRQPNLLYTNTSRASTTTNQTATSTMNKDCQAFFGLLIAELMEEILANQPKYNSFAIPM